MSYLPFSKKIARSLASTNNLTAEKEEVITYALELLILNLLNLVVTLLVGFVLGVLPETLVCVFTVMVFRQLAGGAHSNSPWRCLLVTASVLPLLALAAHMLADKSQVFINILSLIIIVVAFFVINKFAPADTPEAPCVSPQRRKKMKKLSLFALAIFSFFIVVLSFPFFDLVANVKLSIVFALAWISFILTPYGYLIMSYLDMINIKK